MSSYPLRSHVVSYLAVHIVEGKAFWTVIAAHHLFIARYATHASNLEKEAKLNNTHDCRATNIKLKSLEIWDFRLQKKEIINYTVCKLQYKLSRHAFACQTKHAPVLVF